MPPNKRYSNQFVSLLPPDLDKRVEHLADVERVTTAANVYASDIMRKAVAYAMAHPEQIQGSSPETEEGFLTKRRVFNVDASQDHFVRELARQSYGRNLSAAIRDIICLYLKVTGQFD